MQMTENTQALLKRFRESEDFARLQRRRKERIHKLRIADTAGSRDAADELVAEVESLIADESVVYEAWLHANEDLRERHAMAEAWRRPLMEAIESCWDAIQQRRSGESSALPHGDRAKYQRMIEEAAERLSRRSRSGVGYVGI